VVADELVFRAEEATNLIEPVIEPLRQLAGHTVTRPLPGKVCSHDLTKRKDACPDCDATVP
jgi:hypothetical protein